MPRKMTDAELANACQQHISKTDFWDNAEVQGNYKDAIDSYLGRGEKTDAPGFETMRSEDTADVVEALTAEIMPAFHFDELATFEPNSPMDSGQAALESKICNQFIFDFNDGHLEIQAAVKDALLLRNGILKVYADEQIDESRERYSGLNDIELAQVQRKTAANQAIDITLLEFDPETETTSINLTRTTTYKRLAVESIDPCNFVLEKEWTGVDVSQAITVGERRYETRSDLLAKGYPEKIVKNLPASNTDSRQGTLARNRENYQPIFDYHSKALDRIEIYELYLLIDYDNDGIVERRRVIYAADGGGGGKILENKLHPLVPYACGVPFLYPHRWQGISVFDKIQEIESQKSRALSQYVRNMHNANFPEIVVEDGAVAEADITTRRSSGIIRADRIDAVRELPVMDIGSSSVMFLNYVDRVRDARVGSALSMQSAEAQIASDSAMATERMYAPREKMAQLICQTLGDTLVKQTFRVVHQTLKAFFQGPQDFHVGENQFVSTDTATWPTRYKVRVTAGLSSAERNQRRAILEAHLLQQEKLFSSGQSGILMNLDTYYETLVSWSKAGGLQTPRRFWIDPKSDQAIAQQQQNAEQAQQDAAKAEAMQRLLFDTQLAMSDMDRRTELLKHFTQLKKDYWSEVLSSEIDEAKITGQAETDQAAIDADQQAGREQATKGETQQ